MLVPSVELDIPDWAIPSRQQPSFVPTLSVNSNAASDDFDPEAIMITGSMQKLAKYYALLKDLYLDNVSGPGLRSCIG